MYVRTHVRACQVVVLILRCDAVWCGVVMHVQLGMEFLSLMTLSLTVCLSLFFVNVADDGLSDQSAASSEVGRRHATHTCAPHRACPGWQVMS